MSRRPALLLGALALLAACTAPTAPAPVNPPARLVVVEPENRTGDDLIVSGRWDVAMLLGRPVVTVPDVLARDLAQALAAQGFTVTGAGDAGAARLTLTLRRFLPDAPRAEFVVVDLDATLREAGSERVLWELHRDRWIVPTRGAPTLDDALGMAARTVAQDLVADWRPVSSPGGT